LSNYPQRLGKKVIGENYPERLALHLDLRKVPIMTEGNQQTLDEISRCDIIFLTIPVDGIIAISKKLQGLDTKCTVIDLGSTKEKI